MKKIFYLFYLFLSSNIVSQENSIELPLIGDRLSGAVSETEEEILGRQFLRDLKTTKKPKTVTLHLLLIKFFCNINR